MSDLMIWAVESGVEVDLERIGNSLKIEIVNGITGAHQHATLESYRAERLAAFVQQPPEPICRCHHAQRTHDATSCRGYEVYIDHEANKPCECKGYMPSV